MAIITRLGHLTSLRNASISFMKCLSNENKIENATGENYLEATVVSRSQWPFSFNTFSITSLAQPFPPATGEI